MTSLAGLAGTAIGGLQVSECTALAQIELTTPVATLGGIYVYGNPALTALRAPHVTTITNNLIVEANAALTNVELPTALGDEVESRITNNPMSPTCQAVAIDSQVTTSIVISGNGTGTCP